MLDPFWVTIDRTPAVVVETLTLALARPLENGYLPADGSASATFNLTANADARGAVVTLAASSGVFAGVGAGNVVTLGGDGVVPASSVVLFTASNGNAQDAIVTAHAGAVATAPLIVKLAGAPTLDVPTATLRAGSSTSVTVRFKLPDAAGGPPLVSCQALPPGTTTVSALIERRFTVTAPAVVATASMVTVTCRDPYGHAVTGAYRVEP